MTQTIDSSGLYNRANQTFGTKLVSWLVISFVITIITQTAANVKSTLHKIFKTTKFNSTYVQKGKVVVL